jgi:hypothetical protein
MTIRTGDLGLLFYTNCDFLLMRGQKVACKLGPLKRDECRPTGNSSIHLYLNTEKVLFVLSWRP